MKKKAVIVALMLTGLLGLSGCKTWDVVCDVLAVNTTKVEKNDKPKVELDGIVPEVRDEEITEEGNEKVTVPSETPTPTASPVPSQTPGLSEKKTGKKNAMITCISPVNVRDAASSQSHVIGELSKGDKVEKLGEDGGWIKIRYKGTEAWVYEEYMSEKNSKKAEAKTRKTDSKNEKSEKTEK